MTTSAEKTTVIIVGPSDWVRIELLSQTFKASSTTKIMFVICSMKVLHVIFVCTLFIGIEIFITTYIYLNPRLFLRLSIFVPHDLVSLT